MLSLCYPMLCFLCSTPVLSVLQFLLFRNCVLLLQLVIFLISNFGEFRGSHVAWSQNEPSGSIKAKEQKSDETSYVWCTCKLAAMRENSWGNVPSPNLRVKPLHKYGHRRSMRNFNIFSMLPHVSCVGIELWAFCGFMAEIHPPRFTALESCRVLSSPATAEAVAHWIIDEAQRPRGCVLTHLM